MRILLLGGSGQIGWEATRALAGLGTLTVASRSGPADAPLDAADPAGVGTLLDAVQPELIVNAAAYTAVDRAESEPELAAVINADLPAQLGAWAAEHNAQVVHYSTDYVYDGRKSGAYTETDTPNPCNVYGRTKLRGDEALLASGCAAIVLRVSWIYGVRGGNFLLTMRHLMRERDSLRIVDDQRGSPTWCGTVAAATAAVVRALPATPSGRQSLTGVYHLAARGETSWFGFATAIRDRLGLDCELLPIPTRDYPTPAMRPKNSCLDCSRVEATFAIERPHWQDALQDCLQGEPH